jgi:very-short-patch-repair endonuclease
MERKMFFGAKAHIFQFAKKLRDNMTDAETKLWGELKKNQILGFRFRSQHPIDIFIVDFYCHPLKLVIEVDGGIHLSKEHSEYDCSRTEELEKFGIKVIRFTNEQVFNHIEEVRNEIEKEVISRMGELQSPPGDLGAKINLVNQKH